MKIATWNVNGLRACMTKGFEDYLRKNNIDVICLQEIKMNEPIMFEGYDCYYSYAEKKGYSGTAILTRKTPVAVYSSMGNDVIPNEGRTIIADFGKFYLVNCYVPNAKRELARLKERIEWENKQFESLKELDKEKPVLYCGDLNVAVNPIDLFEKLRNPFSAGYTYEERSAIKRLLNNGFTDVFRKFNPTEEGAYTYWSYIRNGRQNNFGWRLDYFLISDRAFGFTGGCRIRNDVYGSDHCPVELEIYM